ncbi:hypothetical protein JZ751_003228 [Albula glossodonta]|uniref:Solute carrier family 66 member 3 n=1 Tax=Albula glossodonta TaxID=121402 RepID=A0A8T2NC40_9TELE|nr:hypothetical protein JZ751_003228 [Albula glossodonta]
MDADMMLHFANFSTLVVCMVLKFPQIFVLIRAKSTTGVSLKSLLLELTGILNEDKVRGILSGRERIIVQMHALDLHGGVCGHREAHRHVVPPHRWTPDPALLQDYGVLFIVFITYQMYYDYPPPTYLEYPILIAQGWQLLTVQKWIIDLAMSLCTFISAGSKFAQLQCLWESKDSGQVSALSWGMATYTCLARVFTTVVTTGDMQVLVRFIVMTVLNGWVTAVVLYYRRKGVKQD